MTSAVPIVFAVERSKYKLIMNVPNHECGNNMFAYFRNKFSTIRFIIKILLNLGLKLEA